MLTETTTSGSLTMPPLAAKAAALRERSPFLQYVTGVAPFLAVVAQFGLIALVVSEWQLESLSVSRLLDSGVCWLTL